MADAIWDSRDMTAKNLKDTETVEAVLELPWAPKTLCVEESKRH